MVEKNNDDKYHSKLSKKRTLRKERSCHPLKVPPSPQWIEAKLADLAECSRLRLLSQVNDFESLSQEPLGLSDLIRLPNSTLLPLPSPEWKQFGFTVLRDEGIVVPRLGTLTSVRWQFAFEWRPSRSAWDALLFSLEHLRLKAFALPPPYVIPTLFIVCMADWPDDSRLNAIMASWGPVLHETCKTLDSLLRALYECWIDGPSQSAFRYRQFIEYLPTEGADYWQHIDPLRRIIGPENLEALLSSEHLEATIIQQLRQASIRLWAKGCLPFPQQEVSTLLTTSPLGALLPLALWQSPLSVPFDAAMTQIYSLDDVLRLWKHAMAID